MEKKNLIFIMCDQMTGQVLDDDSDYLMPNLRALAEEGIKVERAYLFAFQGISYDRDSPAYSRNGGCNTRCS